MIEYNYTFFRDEGDEVRPYHPRYPLKFFNVADLNGNSSTGKSTLMNLIALAFYGSDDPTLSAALRNRVKYLDENQKVTLDFKVEMSTSEGNRLKSHVVKKLDGNGHMLPTEITAYEIDASGNERRIFKEGFRKKYRLIYDIPDDPTKRLLHSIEEIQKAQKDYTDRIIGLKKTASLIEEEIRKSKDPAAIEEYNAKLVKLNEELERTQNTVNVAETTVKELRKLQYAKKIKTITDEIDRLKRLKTTTDKQNRKINTDNKKAESEYRIALTKLNVANTALFQTYRDCYEKMKIIKDLGEIDPIPIDYWFSFNQKIDLSPKDIPEDFVPITNTLIESVERAGKKYKSDNDENKYALLTSLMNILKDYSQKNESIEILQTTTDSIYSELKKELNVISQKVKKSQDYQNAQKSLEECIKKAMNAHQAFVSVPKKPEEQDKIEPGEDIKDKLEAEEKSLTRTVTESSKYGVNATNYYTILDNAQKTAVLLPYLQMDSYQLPTAIRQLENDIRDGESAINGKDGLKSRIAIITNRLEELEKSKEHPLFKYRKYVEKIIKTLDTIQKDLSTKNGILSKFVNTQGVATNLTPNPEQKEYLNRVWKNLGKRLNHIRFIDTEYEITEVNLITSEITTTTGKTIKIFDMGTGESQNAYLLNVLRSNQESCIIAMFDECENMDYNLRMGIRQELISLYDSGHLLLGLTASHGKNEAPRVEEFHGTK